jgi:hypothetical protein
MTQCSAARLAPADAPQLKHSQRTGDACCMEGQGSPVLSVVHSTPSPRTQQAEEELITCAHLNCTLLGGMRTHHTEAQFLNSPTS